MIPTAANFVANIVVDYFLQGGPIMWPILLALLLATTAVVERSVWWWQLRRRSQPGQLQQSFKHIAAGDFTEALAVTAGSDDPHLRTVHHGLVHAHSSLLGAMQLRASDELEGAE